ncbi:MAG: histidine kinase [Treponema sp.]|nr:histidine kinase [Treponema sp.]
MKVKSKHIGFFMQIVFILLTFHFCLKFNFPSSLKPMQVVNISFDILGMIVCVCLYLNGCLEPKRKREDVLFGIAVFFEAETLFCDASSWLFFGRAEYYVLEVMAYSLFYLSSVLMPIVCWFYQMEVLQVRDKSKKVLGGIFIGIFALYVMSLVFNAFFKFYFVVDDATGIYSRGKYYFLSIIPVFVLFITILVHVNLWKANRNIKYAFLMLNIAPYIGSMIQIAIPGLSVTYIALLLSVIVVHVCVQVNLRRKLDVLQNQVLVAQIQPHFLFNTLATIQALCKRNPELAAKTINNFSTYLRGNIQLQHEDLMPFSEELKHINVYTEIEKLRFPNISVEFDIQNSDIHIPFLSVEPLVENSIRHGIRGKEDGFVKITTYSERKFHIIEVQDNGCGFDTETMIPEINKENSSHIGLKNVKNRIESLCNGKMKIESEIGVGTKITIRIPKK